MKRNFIQKPIVIYAIITFFMGLTQSFSSNLDQLLENSLGEATSSVLIHMEGTPEEEIIEPNNPIGTYTPQPENPYTLQNIPANLENDLQFNYLKNWGYRYWVASNGLMALKFLAGVGMTGTANVILWDLIPEESKEGLEVATAILTLSTLIIESLERGTTAKSKQYKKEAKNMIALENLNAGLPL